MTSWNIEIIQYKYYLCHFWSTGTPISTYRIFFMIFKNSPPWVKGYRSTTWWKNEANRSDKWVSKSWHVKTKSIFWHFWSIRLLLHGKKSIFLKEYSNKWKAWDWDFEGRNQASWFGETRLVKSKWAHLKQFWQFWSFKIPIQERIW